MAMAAGSSLEFGAVPATCNFNGCCSPADVSAIDKTTGHVVEKCCRACAIRAVRDEAERTSYVDERGAPILRVEIVEL